MSVAFKIYSQSLAMRFICCPLLSIVLLCFSRIFVVADLTALAANPFPADDHKNNTLFDDPSLSYSTGVFHHEFRWLIESGKLSLARRKALKNLARYKKSDIAKVFAETFQKCYTEGGDEYLKKIRNSLDQTPLRAKNDSPNCRKAHSDWTLLDPYELWDESCSILPRPTNQFSISSSQQNPFSQSPSQDQCCIFTPGSWTYLRLPAIHEPTIQLGIPHSHGDSDNDDMGAIRSANIDSTTFLNLEQDGYLRPFDVAGVLWPTGYMTSLCLGDITGCRIPELHTLLKQYHENFVSRGTLNSDEMHRNQPILAIELGAGIGASSIALASSLQNLGFSSSSQDTYNDPWVVATDVVPYSLALTIANANNNGVFVETAIMDYFDPSSVEEVKEKFFPQKKENSGQLMQPIQNPGGFSLIFGSSLMGLFQNTGRLDSALWRTLDQLLDPNNPNALVILAHSREDVLILPPQPEFPYQLVRRLSASDDFFGNMVNRAGDVSELAISVIQRKSAECRNVPKE